MSGSPATAQSYAPPEPENAAPPVARRGIQSLTQEQIHTWTLEQKDRWWLKNVYRGDMPQLTLRSALTGMVLGAVLTLPNLYVGAQTGWVLGAGVTSVIVSFAVFKIFAKLGIGTEMTILENNAMQSIATAGSYMTAPLIASLTAYMWQTNRVMPVWHAMVWMMCVSMLGVLFAFPLKRRFINDEQLPFPEGAAAGVVMEALHTGGEGEGLFKAKLLAWTAGSSALVKLMSSELIMKKLHVAWATIPDEIDGWLYRIFTPRPFGVSWKDATVGLEPDFVMMAAGGLMGIHAGVSILIGAVVNYCILIPWGISIGDVRGTLVEGVMHYSFKDITLWALWGGVTLLTTSSLVSFFSRPKVIIDAVTGLFRKKKQIGADDPLKDIELPMSVFVIGIPVMGTLVAFLAHAFFEVNFWLALLAVPMVFVFALIAVNATGLTSITPGSALAKLTQITFGALAPHNITTNLIAASITSDVSLNASNLLMDIKPGYMLGGKPRHQAIGHVLGIIAGSSVAAPLFFWVFVNGNPAGMVTGKYTFPAATIWHSVAKVLTEGLDTLPHTAKIIALCGGIFGILLEVTKILTKGRFWLSAVGLGLAFVIHFQTSFAMFFGSFVFWIAGKLLKKPDTTAHQVMVQNHEATSAGIIAGGGLMGIIVVILEKFVLTK